MKQDLKYFIGERAEQLAMVYLTRSKNLVFERMKADYGLDLLVTVLQDHLPTGRVFGVQIKGRDRAFKDVQQEASLTLSQKESYSVQDLPFPVCILIFSMENDKGYYRWLKYPGESGKRFRSSEQNQWRSLDEYPVEQIIEDVNAWYDEKNHSAA